MAIDLTKLETRVLFEELRVRIIGLQQRAVHPGSLGELSSRIGKLCAAYQTLGRALATIEAANGMLAILDEATAQFAGPDTELDEPNVWRDGRRHLWQLVETQRKQWHARADALRVQANDELRVADVNLREALVEPKPFSVRLGEAILARIDAWEARRS